MTTNRERRPQPARRQVLRVDAQDGPWTVSVAENHHRPSSYTLYVKTPTHNLTLSRTARELVELDHKLHDAHPSVSRPALPIDPPQPTKRKSVIMNTLSRLATPASKSTGARNNALHFFMTSPVPSTLPTPVVSPKSEIADPFFDDLGAVAVGASNSANPIITGLAAYLTTLSNDQVFRQARPWKRFVRVRTDDLESVRVERAIRRVYSDVNATMHNLSVLHDEKLSGTDHEPRGAETHEQDDSSTQDEGAPSTSASARSSARSVIEIEASDDGSIAQPSPLSPLARSINGVGHVVDSVPPTSVPAEHPLCIPHSQSADPDKASRFSNMSSTSVDASGTETTSLRSDIPVHLASTSAINTIMHNSSELHGMRHAETDHESREADVCLQDDWSVQDTNQTPSLVSSNIRGRWLHDTASTSALTNSVIESGFSDSGSITRPTSPSPSSIFVSSFAARKVQMSDFEVIRVLGKGCAGKVLLVRHKSSSRLYALKAIIKRHVLAHQDLQHTLTEQAVLRRMAAEGTDPFVVKLWWSFHDKENLFLVMDFHRGGDLATQLARWGRLGRDRARFYAAEIVEGVEGLHTTGIIYRDLKPENILIAADGHIVLTDFGLSKEFPRRSASHPAPGTPPVAGTPHWMKTDKEFATPWPPRHADTTSTFCGTAEYLAPEVIQGLPYSYEVDWWSFGTMLYEMLAGITPFWADNHSDMYVRVLHDELQFPDDRAMDQDTKSLIRGLLLRNPEIRISEPRIKRHPYFSMIDWSHVYYKRYIPPYIPPLDPSNASDTQNFDDTFLDMKPVVNDENDLDTDQEREQTDQEQTDGEDFVATPFQSRSSAHPPNDLVDIFDEYWYEGQHSVIIDATEKEKEEEDRDVTGRSIEDIPALASEPPISAIKAIAEAAAAASTSPDIRHKESKRASVPKPHGQRSSRQRNRRGKSGIPQLDDDLPNTNNDNDMRTYDEGEEGWDFIEADGEESYGVRGPSLFARGVVDRYRLAVFRRGSTPNRTGTGETTGQSGPSSPSPTAKVRRGRTGALPFRRPSKNFLRAKPPPSTSSRSSKSPAKLLTMTDNRTSASMSTVSSPQSVRTTLGQPSLRSKESTVSVGNPGSASGASTNGDARAASDVDVIETVRLSYVYADEDEEAKHHHKNNKLKRGAEKMLSLFGSPR